MTNELGDAPIEKQYKDSMILMAELLDSHLNGDMKGKERTTGFILLVFPFGSAGGRCNYISNGANREDVVCLLKEQIASFEGSPDVKGTA